MFLGLAYAWMKMKHEEEMMLFQLWWLLNRHKNDNEGSESEDV